MTGIARSLVESVGGAREWGGSVRGEVGIGIGKPDPAVMGAVFSVPTQVPTLPRVASHGAVPEFFQLLRMARAAGIRHHIVILGKRIGPPVLVQDGGDGRVWPDFAAGHDFIPDTGCRIGSKRQGHLPLNRLAHQCWISQ